MCEIESRADVLGSSRCDASRRPGSNDPARSPSLSHPSPGFLHAPGSFQLSNDPILGIRILCVTQGAPFRLEARSDRNQGLAAAATEVTDAVAPDPLMTNAAEFMRRAGAAISKARHHARSQTGHIEIVAACRFDAEMAHDMAPFRAVGADAETMTVEGGHMGDLMGYGLVHETLGVAEQEFAVVADHRRTIRAHPGLPGCRAAQIEADLGCGHGPRKPGLGDREESPGACGGAF